MSIKQLIPMIFAVLALAGCASTAPPRADTAPIEGQDAELAENDPNRIVCRREHVVGSNFTRRICRTVKQIEEERMASQRKLEEERTRMLQKALPPPTGN